MSMSPKFARTSIAAALAAAWLSAAVAAQDQTPPPATDAPPAADAPPGFEMPKPPDIAKDFTDAKKTPEAIKAAEEALKATAAAYKAAKSYSDTYTITVDAMGQKQTQSMSLARDPNGMRIEMTPAVFLSANGKVYVHPMADNSKYKSWPLEGDLMKTLEKQLGGFGLPIPRWAYDSAEPKDLAAELAGAFMQTAKIGGFDDANGGSVLLLGDGNSIGVFSIDPKTKLISGAKLNLSPQGAPPGFVIPITLSTQPVVADALANPVAFDETGKTEIASVEELFGAPSESKQVKVGDAAPAFSLSTLDGKTVTLADLKGKVVVVDFWAEWCGPCKRGLPHISDFAKWAQKSGKPIEVYGINTLERTKGDERIKATSDFWKKQGFVMPCLVDMDDAVINSYGFSGIPATVVIGPDGTIVAVHNGIDGSNPAKIVADLKAESAKALGEPAPAAEAPAAKPEAPATKPEAPATKPEAPAAKP